MRVDELPLRYVHKFEFILLTLNVFINIFIADALILYETPNFGGKPHVIRDDAASLGDLDNVVSSVKIVGQYDFFSNRRIGQRICL